MKKLACLLLLLGSFVCSTRAQGTFDAITGFVPGSVSGPVTGTAGWTFRPLEGIQITDLGCLDFLITDQGPMTIGFWDNLGTLLSFVTVYGTNELAGQSRYVSVTPFIISAGQTYTVGAFSPSSGTISVNFVGQPPDLDGSVTLPSNLQLGSLATGAGGFVFPGTLGPAGSMCLGPTFRFRNVPEPSTLALLCVAVLCGRHLRSRNRETH